MAATMTIDVGLSQRPTPDGVGPVTTEEVVRLPSPILDGVPIVMLPETTGKTKGAGLAMQVLLR